MKREQLEYIVLISIGCMAVLYVCFVFLLKPQWKNLKKNIKVESELTLKLQKAHSKIKQLPNLKKNIKSLQMEITEEEKKLLNNEFVAFVKIIKNATEKSGLKLNKIKPENNIVIPRSEFYTEKWIVLECKAPYHVLGKWFYELEKQSPYIKIVNISVNAKKEDMGIHNTKVTVGFLTKTNSK